MGGAGWGGVGPPTAPIETGGLVGVIGSVGLGTGGFPAGTGGRVVWGGLAPPIPIPVPGAGVGGMTGGADGPPIEPPMASAAGEVPGIWIGFPFGS